MSNVTVSRFIVKARFYDVSTFKNALNPHKGEPEEQSAIAKPPCAERSLTAPMDHQILKLSLIFLSYTHLPEIYIQFNCLISYLATQEEEFFLKYWNLLTILFLLYFMQFQLFFSSLLSFFFYSHISFILILLSSTFYPYF